MKKFNEDKHESRDAPSSLQLNLRFLALFTLGLWIAAYGMLLSECAFLASDILRTFIVNTKISNAIVRERSFKSARTAGYLPPHTKVEAFDHDKEYAFIIRPVTGFVSRKLLDPIEGGGTELKTFCPIIGSRIDGRNTTARFTYAPTNLVIAQQLWNALQILQIFLCIGLFFNYRERMSTKNQKVVGTVIILSFLILLPVSIYVTSPGAIIFSVLTLISTIVAVTKNIKLVIDVGEKTREEADDKKKVLDEESLLPKTTVTRGLSWFLIAEETLGFLCNLCSSLYNYTSSQRTWPHWMLVYRAIDKFFGWDEKAGKSMDVFNEKLYTLGLTDSPVPTFVPRTVGSTFGAHLFILLWSIIPFLYVSYFFCMYILAVRAPAVKVQRAFLIFAMFHFLFMTDCVAYKYGRGLRNPYAELFHWFERWAWRVAVLMPIYQNCCTGHWKHGHKRFPILGTMFHYAIGCWGIIFFFLQVLASDVVRFIEFLQGKEDATLFDLLEMEGPALRQFKPFSYHGALVIMWGMYLFLSLSGFKPFYASISRYEDRKNHMLL